MRGYRKLIGSAVLISLTLAGCESVIGARIGMSETQWLATTLIGDLVYMEGSVKAYRSNGAYYYFRNGILVKVDQGYIPAQKIEIEISVR